MPFDHGREAARFQLLIHGASTLRWYPIDRPTLVIGRASDCEIVLGDPSVSRHHVVLEVIDNGQGFDAGRSESGHVGLALMQDLATQLGGDLRVESTRGQGTAVRFELECTR